MKKIYVYLFALGIIFGNINLYAQEIKFKEQLDPNAPQIFKNEDVSKYLGLTENQEKKVFKEIKNISKNFEKLQKLGKSRSSGMTMRSGRKNREQNKSKREMSATGYNPAKSYTRNIEKAVKKILKELTDEQKLLFANIKIPGQGRAKK